MATKLMDPTILDRSLVNFGPEVCGDLEAALRREWLVTNGLGGFASGTLAGINTRRYHGLLVAALTPPVGRTMLVEDMVEWASYNGDRYALSTHEFGEGTIDQYGYRNVQAFSIEGSLPIWVFALGDALLERRVWMSYGSNTTYVSYRVLHSTGPVDLEITPLITYRDFHSLTRGQGWNMNVEQQSDGALIRAYDGAAPFSLQARNAQFRMGGEWYWNFRYREEAARGLDYHGDLFAPGVFTARLNSGAQATLVFTTEARVNMDADAALAAERSRQLDLLRSAKVEEGSRLAQQLTLAADQFIVNRTTAQTSVSSSTAEGKTIIAGYHWFADWGRDTMISLPGLTLATGRAHAAADILRTFGRYVADGLLPNNFPDREGVTPGYNTVDASLWYFLAVRAYYEATKDSALVDDLLPVLRNIADKHIQGTRYHIGVDPADGLLHAGERGVQLTWMDAKIGDWVVTPRIGKPVEINSLWYNALRTLAEFLEARGDTAAKDYQKQATRAKTSFSNRFVRSGNGHLADVVDTPEGDDWSIRPNQIFAVSLPFPLLDGETARAVVDAVGRDLLTTYGLRSLDQHNPAYQGVYAGGPLQRDGGYHQGPVWTWLMGPYVEAYYRVYGNRQNALELLRPFEHHLSDAGLGSISEIEDGDPPHFPRGCIAQAWGVAEVLRVWRMLSQ